MSSSEKLELSEYLKLAMQVFSFLTTLAAIYRSHMKTNQNIENIEKVLGVARPGFPPDEQKEK